MKRFLKIASNLLFIAGLIAAGLFLVARFTGRLPFSMFIVSSGSMEPTVKTGSVVLAIPQNTYQIGEVVTFYSNSTKKSTTTHRIVGAGGDSFRMAGDANNQPDPGLVPRDLIVGTVRLSVPYVGFLAAFAKTPPGFILLVIVPATIIVYEELKSLLSEIKKFFKKLKPTPEVGESQGEGWLRPVIILPVFFALLIPLTLTITYFLDRETSAGNSFMGTSPAPTPTPTPTPTVTVTPTPSITP